MAEVKQEQTVTVHFQSGEVWEIVNTGAILTDERVTFLNVDTIIAEMPLRNIKAIVCQPDKVKWVEAGSLSKEIMDIIRSGG